MRKKKKGCNCKASEDIERLQRYFSPRKKRSKSSNIFSFIWNTIINFIGVVLLVIAALFAVPLLLWNIHQNMKRTGKPYVSLPELLKKPMRYVVNEIDKADPTILNKQENGEQQES